MLIDDKGRLFGKLNIIDLVIILLIIGAGVGAFYKFGKANVGPIVKQDEIIIQFFAEETPDYAAKAVKIGDLAADDNKNTIFGEVIDKPIVAGSLTYGMNAQGEYVESSKPGMSSVLVTVKGKGIIGDTGAVIGGVSYGIGHTMVLRVGKTKLWVKVYDFYKKE